jgi:hypothetical protein
MDQPSSLQEVINQALGLPNESTVVCALLLEGRQFVGYKVRFEGGFAIWHAATSVVEVFDMAGRPLKAVPVTAIAVEKSKAA